MGTRRIEDTFRRARDSGRKVLIAYLCVGDPSPEESVALAQACVDAGADALELGVPFSDPSADGPAIARAAQRALRAGGGLRATLAVASRLRADLPDTPLVLFGYLNPIVVMGEREAVVAAHAAGIDALLLVDLPLGECPDLRAEAARRDLPIVPLVAPTSAPARADAIRSGASGFLYYVSVCNARKCVAAVRVPASCQQKRCACSGPAAANRSRIAGSFITRPMASASAGASSGGQSKAAPPVTSTSEPAVVVITGVPQARASSTGNPKPS